MKNFRFILILTALSLFTGTAHLQSQQKEKRMNDFAKEWQQVEDFSRKGLPKSALKVVEQVYAQAKKKRNSAQMIKALLKQMELKSAFEEDALIKNIEMMNGEIAQS